MELAARASELIKQLPDVSLDTRSAIIIQRYYRGFKGRQVYATMKQVAEALVAAQEDKNRIRKKKFRIAPSAAFITKGGEVPNGGGTPPATPTGMPDGLVQSEVQSDTDCMRFLKQATISYTKRGVKKLRGRWRYELRLECVVAEDPGNVLVGWGSDVRSDAGETWQAGYANGETPPTDEPTRWWGPVFNRAQLASDAHDSATVIISCAVDLDEAHEKGKGEGVCYYNLFVSSEEDENQFESIYQHLGGWQRLEMTDRATDRLSGEDDLPIFPMISIASSEMVYLNLGQWKFEDTKGPPHAKFQQLLRRGEAYPIHNRELEVVGGYKTSIDYHAKMPAIVEYAVQRGSWDQMRLCLAGQWEALASRLLADERKTLTDSCKDTRLLLSGGEGEQIGGFDAHELLTMTNAQSKTIIHIAIEHKRFAFVDHLFDWLPPDENKELERLHVDKSSSLDRNKVMTAERTLLQTQDLDGCNPLLLAILNGQDKMAFHILDKAIALDEDAKKSDEGMYTSVASKIASQKNETGQAALWAAIDAKSEIALKLTLVPDVNNNEKGELGTTPLMRAIEIDNGPMIDALLATEGPGGVDIASENEFHFSAVTLASYLPDREVWLDRLLDVAKSRRILPEIFAAKSSEAEGERTALMYAIDSENTAAAKVLLKYYNIIRERDEEEAMRLANEKSATNATALLIAIEERNAEVVEALVDLLSKDALKGKYRDKEPLQYALKAANVPAVSITEGGDSTAAALPESVVEKLVDARFMNIIADQNDDKDGTLLSSLLDDAVNSSLFGVVTRLLYQGAKPSKASTAAAAGDIEFFERDPTITGETINKIDLQEDDSGSTYLMLACRAGNDTFVDYLLDKYSNDILADVLNRDTGETAIIAAARNNHVTIVKKLLVWAAKPLTRWRHSVRGNEGQTMYSTGGKDGQIEIAKVARGQLTSGDRLAIDAKSKDGTNVLMALCSSSGRNSKELLEVLELLSKMMSEHIKLTEERKYREKHMAEKRNNGRGSLHEKSAKGISPIKVKELKKAFCNLNNHDNDTALDLAVRRDNIELAMALKLSWGAVVSFRSAAVIGSISEFRTIVDGVTAVSDPDPRELFTALHLCCRTTLAGCESKVGILLDRSADPSTQTANGWTPLMFACANADADGKVATVQALLDAHADKDLQNADGATALMLTLKGKQPFSARQMIVAAMLVGAGADIDRRDLEGYSALEDCSQIAGESLGDDASNNGATMEADKHETHENIFATMIHRGVHLGSLGGDAEASKALRAQVQRGFILPNFDLNIMRDGLGGMISKGMADVKGRAKMSVILRAYTTMDPSEIARCATFVYVQDGLFVAMMKGIWLAHMADMEARRVQALDENLASLLRQLSDRIQLSVAGLLGVRLEHNGERRTSVQDFLERYDEGLVMLVAASKYQMKAVLAHPEIQRYTERLWWGWIFTDLITKGAPRLAIYAAVTLTVLTQICLAPIVGLLPVVGQTKDKRLHWLTSRVFGVPVIDFFAASVCNLAILGLLLSNTSGAIEPGYGGGGGASGGRVYIIFMVIWAASDLWSELLELTDGFSLASIRKELLALFDVNYRSEYLIDPFNIFDLLSTLCTTIALVWNLVERELYHQGEHLAEARRLQAEPPPAVTEHDTEYSYEVASSGLRCMLALGIFFGWLRTLRILSMNERMGPFVLMFLVMVSDIVQWLILLAVFVVAMGSAQSVLHAPDRRGQGAHDFQLSCSGEYTPFAYLQTSLLSMFEGSITSNPNLDCMSTHNEYGTLDWTIAWLFAVAFQIIVGLLLLNMLIAKMAKTFDSIWENQGVNFTYLRARTVLMWDEAPIVCSPFIALSWPSIVLAKLFETLGGDKLLDKLPESQKSAGAAPRESPADMGCKPRTADDARSSRGSSSPPLPASQPLPPARSMTRRRVTENEEASVNPSLKDTPTPAGARAKTARRMKRAGTTRALLTSAGARCSTQDEDTAVKDTPDLKMATEAEICEVLVNWILDHEDEVNQSERWRTQMQKKNTKRFDRIDRSVNSLSASLKELKRSQVSSSLMNEKLDQLGQVLKSIEGQVRGVPASPGGNPNPYTA